jgi:hypothetical protein
MPPVCVPNVKLEVVAYFPYKLRLCGSQGYHSPKMVLGTLLPGGNPPKLLFLTPNPLLEGMVAKISLEK